MSTDSGDSGPWNSCPPPLGNTEHPTLALLTRRWGRLNVRDEHWMCCIVGEEGSGKSYTALKIANLLDSGFGADQVIFDPSVLLERLDTGDFEEGDVFVFDEAGVGMGTRSWYDSEQIELNKALQLIRDHNIGVLFTLPRLGELDSQTKGRLQDVIEMREKRDDHVRATWWTLDVDRLDMSSGRDGTWMEKPKYQGREIKSIAFSEPEGKYIDQYERKKSEFQSNVYQSVYSDGDEEEEDSRAVKEIAEEARDDLAELIGWHGGHNRPVLKKERIRQRYDISHADAQAVKERLRSDDEVDIEEVWESEQTEGDG